MKIKWIFTIKVIASQLLFSLPLFFLLLIAMISNQTIDVANLKPADIVTLWIVWLSFPVILIFVTSIVNKVFNQTYYSLLKITIQTLIGFILGCSFALISFSQNLSLLGIIVFFLFPIFIGSVHFVTKKKDSFTTLNF